MTDPHRAWQDLPVSAKDQAFVAEIWVMDSRLPALHVPLDTSASLTAEILSQPALSSDLALGLESLASQFLAQPSDRVYVRLKVGTGWLDGWYDPGARELSPLGWKTCGTEGSRPSLPRSSEVR